MTISFLGPKGTFTEQACIKYDPQADRLACLTVMDALQAVATGTADKCVAPIENSIEGPVNATIDALVFDQNLYIEQLVMLPIEQNILVKPGTKAQDIKKVISHPQGLAQCRKFLREHFPKAAEQITSSTAEAARTVSQSGGDMAAIGPELTAQIYGLDILQPSAQDSLNNRTSFIVVSNKAHEGYVQGNLTSIVFSTMDKPGALYRILDIFSLWDINMKRIISRPMPDMPGSYVFMVDVENTQPQDMEDVFKMIRRKVSLFKCLGSYPVLDYTIGK